MSDDTNYLSDLQDYYFVKDVERELKAVKRLVAEGKALTPSLIFLFWREHRPDLLENLHPDRLADLWRTVSRDAFGEKASCPVGPGYFSQPPAIRDNPMERLCVKYPVTFRGYERPEVEWCPTFPDRGIEFSSTGWKTILDEFCAWLEPQAVQYKLHGFPEEAIPVHAKVAEKFGVLRLFVSGLPDALHVEVWDRMEALMEISGRTCMNCGAPGTMRRGGWSHVACDACEPSVETWR